jgi:hypothetical protein
MNCHVALSLHPPFLLKLLVYKKKVSVNVKNKTVFRDICCQKYIMKREFKQSMHVTSLFYKITVYVKVQNSFILSLYS